MYNVDTTNQRDVWLVKVPKYMANAWRKAPQQAQLGKLQVSRSPGGAQAVKFILDPKLQDQQDGGGKLPSEHSLTLNPLSQQRIVILSATKDQSIQSAAAAMTSATTSNNNERIAFEGDVKFRGELRPTGDGSYMSLKSSLIKQAARPTRVTQILDKAVTSYKPRGAAQLAHEADLRRRKDEPKKTMREDKEIVQGRLFAAFEKRQYYNIKDLERITNQPVPYLKEILKEICNYCSKSTNKNMWELKPEYRHYKTSGSQLNDTK